MRSSAWAKGASQPGSWLSWAAQQEGPRRPLALCLERWGRGLRGLQQQDALVPSAEAAGVGWLWSDLMGQPGSLQLQASTQSASASHQPGHSGRLTLQGCC